MRVKDLCIQKGKIGAQLLLGEEYQPGLSIDCIILSFQEGKLKVLLNKFNTYTKWMIPGGFVFKNENLDDAAYRQLKDRTGLTNIYLKQFYIFGDQDRTNIEENREILRGKGIMPHEAIWFLQRFVSVGYYALVNYDKIKLHNDPEEEMIDWFDIENLPHLYSDHNKIIEKALETIRIQLGYIPIGHELLSEKFTMPELRVIYEAILGKELDRRNFQRKILSTGCVVKLNETRKSGKAHKAPILYSFNEAKYREAAREMVPFTNWNTGL